MAFNKCISLTSVSIPSSVQTIETYAFSYCSGLKSATIPNSVTSIGDGAFYECSGLSEVAISNGISSISNKTFYGCSSLASLTIPNTVISIGDNAFSNCSGLKSVVFPSSVKFIGSSFENCSGLKSVTIPASVTSIGNYTFSKCNDLTDVYCKATTLRGEDEWYIEGLYAHKDVFMDSYPQFMTLHVPASSIEAYRSTEPWCYFKEIVPLTDEEIDPTTIKSVIKKKTENEDIFNLLGVRLKQPKKGVNIINGKKIIIK